MIHGHLRADSRPLYAQASEALKELVRRGGYVAGARLPSEHELAEQLGISRPTLREALRLLEEEGLIVRRHGVGTFVAVLQPVIEGGLEILESLAQIARRRGLCTGVEGLHIEARPATTQESVQLKIDVRAPVTTITRVMVVTAAESYQRVAYLTDIVPAEVLGESDLTADFAGSVLDLLQMRGWPALSHSATELSAEAADLHLARALHVPRGAALLKNRSPNSMRATAVWWIILPAISSPIMYGFVVSGGLQPASRQASFKPAKITFSRRLSVAEQAAIQSRGSSSSRGAVSRRNHHVSERDYRHSLDGFANSCCRRAYST